MFNLTNSTSFVCYRWIFVVLTILRFLLPTVRSSCDGVCQSKLIVNNTDIKSQIAEHISHDKGNAINCFDTSSVTEMDGLFSRLNSFNEEISCWNTAGVTEMNVCI